MALTAIDIYKLLPKTNCRECGQSTCLAFAMQIAAGKATIDLCPPASEEAREKLSAAAAPPLPQYPKSMLKFKTLNPNKKIKKLLIKVI